MNLLSRIEKERRQWFHKTLYFYNSGVIASKLRKSAEEPRAWYLEYFLYFYCITGAILFGNFNFNSPSLKYDENHSAQTQNTITTFLKF